MSEAESNDSEVDGKEYGVNYDPKSQKSLKPYKVLAVSPLWFISNRKLVNMIQGCAIIHLINIPCYNYYILLSRSYNLSLSYFLFYVLQLLFIYIVVRSCMKMGR